MALPLGKLTIFIGAGIVGSVLAKEGRASNVSDFFTGAIKIAFRLLKNDDSATARTNKKDNATLLQQVNRLREELQYLASNRPVAILTSTRSGSGNYSVIVVVVVIGYGYIWWKGWIPNLMFATRRSLSDACRNVSIKLEGVYSSIAATKQILSSKIEVVECKIDECTDNTTSTRDEVSRLLEDVRMAGANVQSVHDVVQSLENKITSIEDKQEQTMGNVAKLIKFAWKFEKQRSMNQIDGSSSSSLKPVLELPELQHASATPSRIGSLPSNLLLEPPSPSTPEGHHKPYEILKGVDALGQSIPRTPVGIVPTDIASNESGFRNLSSSLDLRPVVRRTFSASLSFEA